MQKTAYSHTFAKRFPRKCRGEDLSTSLCSSPHLSARHQACCPPDGPVWIANFASNTAANAPAAVSAKIHMMFCDCRAAGADFCIVNRGTWRCRSSCLRLRSRQLHRLISPRTCAGLAADECSPGRHWALDGAFHFLRPVLRPEETKPPPTREAGSAPWRISFWKSGRRRQHRRSPERLGQLLGASFLEIWCEYPAGVYQAC